MIKFFLDDPYAVEALGELIFYDDYLYNTFRALANPDGEDKNGSKKKRRRGTEMPSSKYKRELRFIDTETRRLGRCLQELRETMLADLVKAARKADEVLGIEAKIGELFRRRREIEDFFITAGTNVPDVGRNLNANVYIEGPAFEAPHGRPQRRRSAPRDLEESNGEDQIGHRLAYGYWDQDAWADMNDDNDEK